MSVQRTSKGWARTWIPAQQAVAWSRRPSQVECLLAIQPTLARTTKRESHYFSFKSSLSTTNIPGGYFTSSSLFNLSPFISSMSNVYLFRARTKPPGPNTQDRKFPRTRTRSAGSCDILWSTPRGWTGPGPSRLTCRSAPCPRTSWRSAR